MNNKKGFLSYHIVSISFIERKRRYLYVDNGLVMITNRSISLNFLIYLQNIYINQSQKDVKLRFPYLSSRITFKKDFKLEFQLLWDDISNQISLYDGNDLKLFYREKETFYNKLYNEEEGDFTSFNEVYTSYLTWWESFAGGFVVERSVDELSHRLYKDIVNLLKESRRVSQKTFHVYLIYDECIFANPQVSSNFAVIPIIDFYINYKKLVLRLKECFI